MLIERDENKIHHTTQYTGKMSSHKSPEEIMNKEEKRLAAAKRK